ncbi:MAG: Hint domain-containing protein [Deltaproteobacteria bacterium]|nr:Hint domain-containing protein [Kofleriaceae bacterium]
MRGGRTNIAAISAGSQHTCTRQTTGDVHCFGANTYGQSGAPGSSPVVTPNLVFVDVDVDGIDDRTDNCPTVANFDQLDSNVDGQGDACECLGVVCQAQDACHDPGTCSPVDGTCSNPVTAACAAPPAWPASSALVAASLGPSSVELQWTEATHPGGIDGYRLYRDGAFLIEVSGGQTTHTVGGLTSGATYLFRIEARSDLGGESGDGPSTLVSPTPPPAAPPLSGGEATTTGEAAGHLYTGPGAVQTGVDPEDIVPERAAIVRGLVTTMAGLPMVGARVVVKDHPELGETTTQADGTFSLAVNGGDTLVIAVEAPQHLPAHRVVEVSWSQYTWIDDIALVSYAGSPETNVMMGAGSMQHARGNVETDADGTRQATLLIPPGTQATLIDPDGTQTPMTALTVRATEYTVGANGVRAMPAPMPPNIAYTYAVELSADEALETGAARVQFDRPLSFYVDNFLDFEVGGLVPMGYYDRELASWIASTNGRVIAIVGETAGLADLDVDGDGAADGAMSMALLGITVEERQRLAALYNPGQELWRVQITHFTPYDTNWGIWPPDDMEVPYMPLGKILEAHTSRGCEQSGSVINCENQSLGEEIEITGTPFSLRYESRRAFGRHSERTVVVPLSQGALGASCLRIHARFLIAGRRVERHYSCAANQHATFTWDGFDAWGRQLQGSQALTIQLGYEYQASFAQVPSFGGWPTGGEVSGNRGGRTFTVWSTVAARIGGRIQTPANSIGGWSLDAHHHVDAASGTLERGDGSSVSFGRGGAIQQLFTRPLDYWSYGDTLAMSPEGGLYYADAAKIQRRNRDGTIEHIAGDIQTNGCGGQGHGGPAVEATIGHIYDLAVGPGGVLYAATRTFLWRIVPGGEARVIATYQSPNTCMAQLPPGTTVPVIGTAIDRVTVSDLGTIAILGSDRVVLFTRNGQATPAQLLNGARDVEYGGTRLFVGAFGGIWELESDEFVQIAGNPMIGHNPVGDGKPATEAGVAEARDLTYRNGSLYFVDGYGSVIRRVSGNHMSRVAGIPGQPGEGGDGGDPLSATVSVHGMVATPEGGLIIHQPSATVAHNFRRIRSYDDGIASPSLDGVVVPSEDGNLAYVLRDGDRRLEATVDSVTGEPVLNFTYDTSGRLATIRDPHDNTVTIQRDGAGRPTAIVGPHGHVTSLTVDANGYLRTVTNPEGETITLAHDAGGLLTSMIDAKNYEHTYEYDLQGRLRVDNDPIGFKSLLRFGRGFDATVHVTTALGIQTTYEARRLEGTAASVCPSPALGMCMERKVTRPDGSFTLMRGSPDGQTTVITPDGTRIDTVQGPDPRWGAAVQSTRSVTVTPPGGSPFTATYETLVELYDPDDPVGVRRLTERSTATGGTSETVWDGDARTSTTRTPEGRTSTDHFDDLGRVIRSEVPGRLPIEFFYDARGRLDHFTQGDRFTSYHYDQQSGFLQSASARTSGGAQPAIYQVTSQTYDGIGRTLTSTDAAGAVTITSYDDNSNVRTVAPPGRPVHVYDHGAGDLPASYTPPPLGDGLSRIEQYLHDDDGRPDRTILPDGRTVIFEHEAGTGRLRTTRLADWGTITVTYGAASRVDSIVRDDSMGPTTVAFTYDGPDVSATALTHAAVSGSVAYDRSQYQSNRRITETVNGGQPILYTYDRDLLLTGAGALSVVNDPNNGARTSRAVNSVAESVTYNAYGDPEVVATTAGGAPLLSRTYGYNHLGRIDAVTESITGGAPVTRRFRYDLSGRLETVTDAAGTPLSSYTYDSNGNRTSAPGVAAGSIFVDDHDRLLNYGSQSFTYTRNGEVATRSSGALTTTYTWDTLGALRRVGLPGGGTIEYLVDPAGHRIGKRVNGALAYGFLYNGADRPAAQQTGGVVTSRYVYSRSFGAPDYMVKNGTTYAFVTDHLGSVRLVVNAVTGAIAQRIDYDEFGVVLSDTSPGFQPFGYAGGLYDADTGLVQFGAREYDARTGRWMSRDALGLADGGNVYEYVGSDPINLKDPTGTLSWPSLEDVSNFAAGFGDRITFGGTQWIRRQLGVDDVVDKCSGWYMGGGIAGDLVGGYLMGAGLARIAGAGASVATSCKNSFAAGTPVHTPDGLVPIESLAPGDLVLSRDDRTGEFAYQPIHHVIVTADKRAYDLRLERDGIDETLGVTSEHPFWLHGEGWTKAAALAAGDLVFADGGGWARVVSNAPGARQPYVYNLVVDDDHTFFVGETGAWVHNCRLIVAETIQLVQRAEGTRKMHNRQANLQLLSKMAADPKYERAMRMRGITISKNSTARELKGAPGSKWTWHHVPHQPGVMQLIPRAHHASRFWAILHPGNTGGFKLWGKLY